MLAQLLHVYEIKYNHDPIDIQELSETKQVN